MQDDDFFPELQTSPPPSDHEDDEDDMDSTEYTSWFDTNQYFPFKNKMEMIIFLFFKCGKTMFSKKQITKVMALIAEVLKASHERRGNATDFNPLTDLPALSRIFDYQKRSRTSLPKFNINKQVVTKANGDMVDLHMIKPSDHLKLLLGNPAKADKLTCLPDRSKGTRLSLNQGEKWSKHPEFRHPMLSSNDSGLAQDMYIGDFVKYNYDQQKFIISNFFLEDGVIKFECYRTLEFPGFPYIVIVDNSCTAFSVVDLQSLASLIPLQQGQELNFRSVCYNDSIGEHQVGPLTEEHATLASKITRTRRWALDGIQGIKKPLKVKLIPIILWSDDTSGGTTKKWNPYETFLMNIAAMELKERNKYDNQFFICTHTKLSAMDMVSPICQDLDILEKEGIMMYDVTLDETVLVFAPVLFLAGDNVRHAEFCLSKGSSAMCPCRRCFWQADPQPSRHNGFAPLRLTMDDFIAPARTNQHLLDFAINNLTEMQGDGILLNNRGRNGGPQLVKSWDRLGFKLTGAQSLLKLDALDLTTDTPIEALHTVLLGITKYALNISFGNFLNNAQKLEMERHFRNYKSKAYRRNLYSSLRYHKSFLGRDFKIVVQQLPTVLGICIRESEQFQVFAQIDTLASQQLQKLFTVFDHLGDIVSILYMERVKINLPQYLQEIHRIATKLVNALDELTHTVLAGRRRRHQHSDSNGASFEEPHVFTAYRNMSGSLVNRLKTHLLIHLTEDVTRFASIIHTEAERGEQFNKEVHRALEMTNRHETNRDTCKLFWEKLMFKQIARGGTWDDGSCVAGSGVTNFAADPKIQKYFLDVDDEFADYNNGASRLLRVGSTALFHYTKMNNGVSQPVTTLGTVISISSNRQLIFVEAYEFIPKPEYEEALLTHHQRPSIFNLALRCPDSNFLTRRASEKDFVLSDDDYRFDDVFDMSQSVAFSGIDYMILNKSKFG
ncbi:MAG: hypothetical protein ACTIHF_06790, partial [Streptococcus thermophilus]